MPTVDSVERLKDFLSLNIPKAEFEGLIDNTEEEQLLVFVNDNFDVFGEVVLRKLVKCALKARDDNCNADGSPKVADSQLLGLWGQMIDAVREVTADRQEQAGAVFKEVVATAQQEGPKSTATLLSRLYRASKIDRLFVELIEGAIEQCEKTGNADSLEMFAFVKKVIDQNKAVEKARASQNADAGRPHPPAAPTPTTSSSAASSADKLPAPPVKPPPRATSRDCRERQR